MFTDPHPKYYLCRPPGAHVPPRALGPPGIHGPQEVNRPQVGNIKLNVNRVRDLMYASPFVKTQLVLITIILSAQSTTPGNWRKGLGDYVKAQKGWKGVLKTHSLLFQSKEDLEEIRLSSVMCWGVQELAAAAVKYPTCWTISMKQKPTGTPFSHLLPHPEICKGQGSTGSTQRNIQLHQSIKDWNGQRWSTYSLGSVTHFHFCNSYRKTQRLSSQFFNNKSMSENFGIDFLTRRRRRRARVKEILL